MGKSFTKRLASVGGSLWDRPPPPRLLLSCMLKTRLLLGRVLKGYPEYDENQARGEDGKWTAGGGGGGATDASAASASASAASASGSGQGWRRAARTAGMLAFGVGATALSVRGLQAYRMLSNAARIGGGSKVSRSLLESSAYNLTGVRSSLDLVPYRWELARRFPGANTAAFFGRDIGAGLQGVIVSVRHGNVTREAIAAGKVPPNVFLAEALLAETSLMGRVLFVGNLYSPPSAAGALFSRNFMNTVMRTAIANRVDHIRTFAGSSMGGYLWPQRGFELASPMGDLGKALRSTIATRAGQMLDGGAITRGQYDEIAAIVARWGKDSPTELAHLSAPVAMRGLQLKDFPDFDAVRGEMTVGKALLAGTQSFYVLPRHKYESFLRITKRDSTPIGSTRRHRTVRPVLRH